MKYEEIGEMNIADADYADKLCDLLEANGFQTALIFYGTCGPVRVRILKERK